MTDPATVAVLRALLVDGPMEPDGVEDGARPDWGYVERFLVDHGMGGLAVRRQKRDRADGNPGPLPDQVAASLEPLYLTTAIQTQVRLETDARVRTILSEMGIPSLSFKGAALVRSGVYDDPGARWLEDVDVLVRPGDADRAVTALVERGFRPWVPWERSRLAWLSSFTLDDTVAPSGITSTVDLHWGTLYGALRLREASAQDPLWRYADLDRGLPTAEAHFVLIADHFLKHLRVVRHLRGLADLALLAERVRDLDALHDQARARGSETRLATTVRVLRDLYGLALRVDAGPTPPPTRNERRYLSPARLLGTPGRPIGRIAGLVMRWRLDRASLSSRQLRDVLGPSEAWLRSRYPDSRAGVARLRVRYGLALIAWALGLGPSPLSPNQEPMKGPEYGH